MHNKEKNTYLKSLKNCSAEWLLSDLPVVVLCKRTCIAPFGRFHYCSYVYRGGCCCRCGSTACTVGSILFSVYSCFLQAEFDPSADGFFWSCIVRILIINEQLIILPQLFCPLDVVFQQKHRTYLSVLVKGMYCKAVGGFVVWIWMF